MFHNLQYRVFCKPAGGAGTAAPARPGLLRRAGAAIRGAFTRGG